MSIYYRLKWGEPYDSPLTDDWTDTVTFCTLSLEEWIEDDEDSYGEWVPMGGSSIHFSTVEDFESEQAWREAEDRLLADSGLTRDDVWIVL